MIDKVKLEVHNFYHSDARHDVKSVIEWRGLEFTNKSAYLKDGTCFTSLFWCKHENLFLRIVPGKNLLIVENSLHHYFNRGKGIGNSDDFTLNNVCEVMRELSERLGMNLDEAKVKEVELGVNIPSVNSLEAHTRLVSLKGVDYTPMQARRHTYGSVCKFDQWRIKAYDKRRQLQLQKHLIIDDDVFRFEIAVTNMSFLHKRKEPIPLVYGCDLYDYEVVQYLVHELVTKYADSVKGGDIDVSKLDLRELTSVARMRDKDVCEMVYQKSRETYKKDSRTYNRLLREHPKADNSILYRLIKEKCIDLLHS